MATVSWIRPLIGPSASWADKTTYQWDPFKLLDVDPDAWNFTCVGYAPSKGRRCRIRIAADNRRSARNLLDDMAQLDLCSKDIQHLLVQLASRVLCKRWHQDQASRMLNIWQSRIELFRDFRAPGGQTSSSQSFSSSLPPLPSPSSRAWSSQLVPSRLSSIRSATATIEARPDVERCSSPAAAESGNIQVSRSVENPKPENLPTSASLGQNEARNDPVMRLPEDVRSLVIQLTISLRDISTSLDHLVSTSQRDQQLQRVQPSERNDRSITVDPTTQSRSSSDEASDQGDNISDLSPGPIMIASTLRNNADPQLPEQTSQAPESNLSTTVQTSEWFSPPGDSAKTHVVRRPLNEFCSICWEGWEDDGQAVWCKTQCGQNFHKACMDRWNCEREPSILSCPFW